MSPIKQNSLKEETAKKDSLRKLVGSSLSFCFRAKGQKEWGIPYSLNPVTLSRGPASGSTPHALCGDH